MSNPNDFVYQKYGPGGLRAYYQGDGDFKDSRDSDARRPRPKRRGKRDPSPPASPPCTKLRKPRPELGRLLLVFVSPEEGRGYWKIIKEADILARHYHIFPPPGMPMVYCQRTMPFHLTLYCDGGFLELGTTRIFGRLTPGKACFCQ